MALSRVDNIGTIENNFTLFWSIIIAHNLTQGYSRTHKILQPKLQFQFQISPLTIQ